MIKMPDYETLDAIADSYIPVLAIWVLGYCIVTLANKRWASLKLQGGSLVLGLAVAYGLMILDNYLGIWPSVGLDYSTHTAVSLVLVIHIVLFQVRAVGWFHTVIFCLYLGLMKYQQYHTFADMFTTGPIVGGLYGLAYWRLKEFWKPD